MAFYVVIYWNPADVPPFEWDSYTSKPHATKADAWKYVQRVIEKAKLSDVQLHDIAVYLGKPRQTAINHEQQSVCDYALWRLHGRKTSYARMFF